MKTPKRIILSRTDSIGDVMLTLPMAGWAKKHWPEVEIVFLGRAYTQSVVERCSFVDEFIDVSPWEGSTTKASSELKALQADMIFFALPNKFLAKAAKRAAIPYRVGVSRRWFHKLYCNVRPTFSRRKSDLHEAQLNLKLMESFISDPIPKVEALTSYFGFSAPALHESAFHTWLQPDKKQIILHPKSQGSAREWGLNRYAELIEKLDPQRYQVFLTGTEKEGVSFRSNLPINLEHVTDVSGQMTLTELIAFIDHCDALIACSTGPLHLAAALGKVSIGLYSPIRPIHPGRWAPIGPHASTLVFSGKIPGNVTARKDRSVEQITAEEVLHQLEHQLLSAD